MRPSFAYALARMHARIATRPDEAARRRLTSIDDFGHFLQSAAGAGYGAWVARLAPTSGVHTVELALRLAYRAQLDEVAEWLPESWRPAVRWLALAPELPALGALLDEHERIGREQRGGEQPDWIRDDPLYRPLLDHDEGKDAAAAVGERWPALASTPPGELAAAWRREARALMPALSRTSREAMTPLLRLHAESPNLPLTEARIDESFRRAPAAAVRVFAWLSLLRIDLDFLRGELALRRMQAGSQFRPVRAGEAA